MVVVVGWWVVIGRGEGARTNGDMLLDLESARTPEDGEERRRRLVGTTSGAELTRLQSRFQVSFRPKAS